MKKSNKEEIYKFLVSTAKKTEEALSNYPDAFNEVLRVHGLKYSSFYFINKPFYDKELHKKIVLSKIETDMLKSSKNYYY